LKAVENVRSGRLTVANAVRMYNIPKTTINDHIKGRKGVESKSFGRPTALSLDVELRIANNLRVMEKYGYSLSRNEVFNLVRLKIC